MYFVHETVRKMHEFPWTRTDNVRIYYLPRVGCALVFASEAKFEIEAKISFRFQAKKGIISLDSHQSEKAKI
jgi:hypothetical protein